MKQIDLTKVTPVKTEETVSLVKGANVALSKDEAMTVAAVGLAWDPITGSGDFDADASCFLIGEDGKLINNGIIYFGKVTSDCGGVAHQGDNLTGEGDGDDETILVDLEELDASIQKVVFVANIYQGEARGQNFGQVDNCAIRVYNPENSKILAEYDLAEDYSTETGVFAGELYKKNGVWKFKALGAGKAGDLNALAADYK